MSHSVSEAALSPDGIKRIHESMNRYVTDKKIPGMILAVEHYGYPVCFECLGEMNIESQKPMQPDAIFRLQSMTKPPISVASLILEEAGKLSLDDPLSKYIPEFAEATVFTGLTNGNIEVEALERPITLIDLLRHTAGIISVHPEPLLNERYLQLDALDLPLAENVRHMAHIPLTNQPGSKWTYGRTYDVLGYVLEQAADLALDTLLQELIFTPLGMVDTDFHISEQKAARLATLYTVTENGLTLNEPPATVWPWVRPVKFISAGSHLLSTATDYLRFARMLLNKGELDGVRLLKPETVELMTTNQLIDSLYPLRFSDEMIFSGIGYGLGVDVIVEPEIAEAAGAKGTYSWGGLYNTNFWIDPQNEVIGLLLTQFEPPFLYPIDTEFRSLVYEAI